MPAVAHVAPFSVPVFALPEASVVVVPLPSSNAYAVTRPVGVLPGGVMVITAVRDVVLSDAVTVADWLAVTVPAVAVKEAALAPAEIVTDAGMLSDALSSDKVTAVAALAAAESVTVQAALVPDAIETGEQLIPESVGAVAWPTVMAPPVPVAPIETPPADTAIVFVTEIGTDPLLVAESFTETTAVTPFPIVCVLEPDVTQVREPVPAAQFSVLPAAVSAVPAVAVIDATFALEYVKVHCKAAGKLAPEVTDKFNETVPDAAPDPEPKLRLLCA